LRPQPPLSQLLPLKFLPLKLLLQNNNNLRKVSENGHYHSAN
jgi:hypothetical protein